MYKKATEHERQLKYNYARTNSETTRISWWPECSVSGASMMQARWDLITCVMGPRRWQWDRGTWGGDWRHPGGANGWLTLMPATQTATSCAMPHHGTIWWWGKHREAVHIKRGRTGYQLGGGGWAKRHALWLQVAIQWHCHYSRTGCWCLQQWACPTWCEGREVTFFLVIINRGVIALGGCRGTHAGGLGQRGSC